MFKIFLQPYPLWDSKTRKFYLILGISLFVFLFLYVFKPFGLNRFEAPDSISIFLGYSAVSFLLLIFLQFTVPSVLQRVFNEDKWKVYKEILYILSIISIIGIGNNVVFRLGRFCRIERWDTFVF